MSNKLGQCLFQIPIDRNTIKGMTNFIHPTALIDSKAKIGKDNYIGPYCIIGPDVVIGDGNRFEAFVSIGTAAQHRDYFLLPAGPVRIGDNNVFRESVTVNGGTTDVTVVENNCTLLIGSHVGHDTVLKSLCNLGNNTNLGGHCIINTGANLGLSVVVHQHRIIGAYAMIGMNSTVTKDMPPFLICHGSPCEARRLNRVGLQRNGLSKRDLLIFENWFDEQANQYENLYSLEHSYNKYIEEFISYKSHFKNQKSA